MSKVDRRSFVAAALGSAVAWPVRAQGDLGKSYPAQATPRDWSGATPVMYPDPDILTLDRSRFGKYVLFNTTIQRLHTGTLWAEGPAWSGAGRFMVWSDIPNNVQLRWIADDNRVTVFHNPSGYSNGNTFDREGRQLSCEHGGRRVARYEINGSVTAVAEKFENKRLNSPNDVVVHPNDGSIWFTDPTYGINGNYEGFQATPELKQAVYRVDGQSGTITKVTDEVGQPNGLCFSPDLKRFYVADTGLGETKVWDVDGNSLRNGRTFVKLAFSEGPSAADGIRCDIEGNVWAGARPGVQIIAPNGDAIGLIRLPEQCANICFGGVKRNRLFMAASQSLYAVYVGTAGAGLA